MDALSVRVSSVKNKTGRVPGPTCTSAYFLVPTPYKGKSLDISRKVNDIKEPLYKLKRAWEKSSQFFLGSLGDLVQLLPEQTPSISPFLNFPLFLLSLCIVLSRSFDVRQLANSKLRRLPPLTFDWRSDRSSEFLWRVPPKWGILPLSSVSTPIWDIRAEDRLKQKFWSFTSQIYKQVKRINSLWKKLSI